MVADPIADLERAAKARGATLEVKNSTAGGGYHVQIRGALLVNYWPYSRRQSAHVAGTTRKRDRVSPADAVALAFEPPPLAPKAHRDQRSNRTRKIRAAIGRRMGWFCYWCKAALTLDSSTIEHRIPLARGGLDNSNNRVLACHKCNQCRGHDMPELARVES